MVYPPAVRIDEDFFRLPVEDWPVTDGVAHNTIAVRCVLENEGRDRPLARRVHAVAHTPLYQEVNGLTNDQIGILLSTGCY